MNHPGQSDRDGDELTPTDERTMPYSLPFAPREIWLHLGLSLLLMPPSVFGLSHVFTNRPGAAFLVCVFWTFYFLFTAVALVAEAGRRSYNRSAQQPDDPGLHPVVKLRLNTRRFHLCIITAFAAGTLVWIIQVLLLAKAFSPTSVVYVASNVLPGAVAWTCGCLCARLPIHHP